MRRAAPSVACLLVAVALAGSARAAPSIDDARRQAKEAEAARQAALDAQKQAEQRAAAARSALAGLAAQRADALAKLQSAERRTLDAADRMAALDREARDAEAALQARAAQIAPLLPLIERLSLYPSETLLAVPASPDAAARGLIVLQGITRRLESQAVALKQEEARYASARSAVAAQSPLLAAARTGQEQAAEELDRQIAAAEQTRNAAEREAEAAAGRAAQFAARATTLRALLDRLEDAQRAEAAQKEASRKQAGRKEGDRREREKAGKPSPPPADTAPPGSLIVPVAGSVVRDWGAPTEAGPAEGISYRAAPDARVVAPCSGRVAFAAPFRSYGNLAIISCGGGIDVVLSGFAALAVRPGQAVRRGNPVGTMPDWSPAASAPRPTLYVEIRRHGDPVDPGPLMKNS